MADETVAVLMTCHNRKALTLASIAAITAAGRRAQLRLTVYLTDDGSKDATGDAVREGFPETVILEGDGSLYWNRGMLNSWQRAARDRPDFYLWLNDDLAVAEESLVNMMACFRAKGAGKIIVAGKTLDPDTDEVTYGVYARAPGWSRLRFRHLHPGEEQGVTMNGNLVLMPASVVADIGMNNPAFRHATGDVDYGLRATKAGYPIWECPQPVGRQDRNQAHNDRTTRMTLKTARRTMTDPKGVVPAEWLAFTRAHGGPLWPVNFVFRYAKMLANGYRHQRGGHA